MNIDHLKALLANVIETTFDPNINVSYLKDVFERFDLQAWMLKVTSLKATKHKEELKKRLKTTHDEPYLKLIWTLLSCGSLNFKSWKIDQPFYHLWWECQINNLNFEIVINENKLLSEQKWNDTYCSFYNLAQIDLNTITFKQLYDYCKIIKRDLNDEKLLNQDYLVYACFWKKQHQSGSTKFWSKSLIYLVEQTFKELNQEPPLATADLINQSLARLASTKWVWQTFNNQWTLNIVYQKESRIFWRLKELANTQEQWINKNDLNYLDQDQINAFKGILTNGLTFISGGPGCGKTTLIKEVVDLAKQNYRSILLLAPTGKAAQVLANKTNFNAMTIHKWLEQGGDDYCDLLVIDEFSMVDIDLMDRLLKRLKTIKKFVIVGDHHQLPAISYGNLLNDYQNYFPNTWFELKHNHRQNLDHNWLMIKNALDQMRLNHPDVISLVEDFWNPDINIEAIVNNFDVKQDQIIVLQNQGIGCRSDLNQKIQFKLFANDPYYRHNFQGKQFLIGDRVICLNNNYQLDVANGEIGYIKDIERDPRGGIKNVIICFNDRNDHQEVLYDAKTLYQEIDLAYAITVFKAQGSEFTNVDFVVSDATASVLWSKQALYTAISRAQKRLKIHLSHSTLVGSYQNHIKRITNTGDLVKSKTNFMQKQIG